MSDRRRPFKMIVGPDGQLVKARVFAPVKPGWHVATDEEIAASKLAALELETVVSLDVEEAELEMSVADDEWTEAGDADD